MLTEEIRNFCHCLGNNGSGMSNATSNGKASVVNFSVTACKAQTSEVKVHITRTHSVVPCAKPVNNTPLANKLLGQACCFMSKCHFSPGQIAGTDHII